MPGLLRTAAPLLVAGLVGAAFIAESVYDIVTTGISEYIQVFCIPAWCYVALPLSLIVFSSFMILIAAFTKWGWQAIPYAGFAALLYDAIGSIGNLNPLRASIGVDLLWGCLMFGYVWIFKPRFKLTLWLIAYLMTLLIISRLYIQLTPYQGALEEAPLEIFWCVVMWRMVLPREKVQ